MFIACSTFAMPWSLRASALRIVMASAVSALGLLIMVPVTTTSCSSGVSALAEAGASCPMAVKLIRETANPAAIPWTARRLRPTKGNLVPEELFPRDVCIMNLPKIFSSDVLRGSSLP